MSERRRIYRDADGIRKTMIWDDEEPDQVTVHTEQDLEEILGGIARDCEIQPQGLNKRVATLPAIVVEDLINRGIYNDEDAFKRWLNSSEAEPWRIWKGRV